jgi:hypothetical protein
MPIEILERIIAFAIPNDISVKAAYIAERAKQQKPYGWSPPWIAGLLLVSKTIRAVAQRLIRARVHFDFVALKAGPRRRRLDGALAHVGREAWAQFCGRLEKDYSTD